MLTEEYVHSIVINLLCFEIIQYFLKAIGRNKVNTYYTNLSTMMSMVMTQATGVPDGNHGLFHR